jgi:hypothetical protein
MIFQSLTLTVKKNVIQYCPMSEEKREEEEDVAPSMNPREERPNLQDYKSKDKGSSSSSNSTKTTDFTSVTTIPTPEGDVQAETELQIPLEDNKENVKSETKPPKVKTSPEKEEPSFTTVSKEEL